MSFDKIKEEDDVLLILDTKRSYLIKVKKNETFHTHKGYINLDMLINRSFGEVVSTNIGFNFTILKPTAFDYAKKILRTTQVVYLKDIALIIAYSGITSGSLVVEAGTGSGVLTNLLANYVKPDGKICSYEIRREFLENARKNLLRTKNLEYVELKNKDITLGIDEKNVDSVVLDLATPWLVIPKAYDALKGSGFLVSFSPTIEQVIKTVIAMNNLFVCIETIECIVRKIKVEEGATRPETLMVGHTGYITFGRKILAS